MKIIKIWGREVLDSRGNPTLEVEISTQNHKALAIVPSGASTGIHEACELRDGDAKRYIGKGVLKACHNVNHILAPKLLNFDSSQNELDSLLIDADGTANKSKLGANALLGVSMAFAKVSALELNLPLYSYFAKLSGQNGVTLPLPLMNILNGGAHADNNLDFQEIMIVPKGFKTFSRALQAGVEVFHTLKKVLSQKGLATSVGDEGGFAPAVTSNANALELVALAIKNSGYQLGDEVAMALDVAASEFCNANNYTLKAENNVKKTSSQMIDYYQTLMQKFPLVSIEDGLAEEDWTGWSELTKKIGSKTQLVGDDLFVTNPKLLKHGIEKGVANSILIKVNQIGTVSETLEAILMAKKAGYTTIISHRSGETEDTTIADLAVGVDAGQIKTGSLCRTDRVAKYNQLLRIEETLGSRAVFGTINR